MIIFECSIHNFHASFDTFSYTRLPNSPRHGTRSSPGKSLSNFTQCTIRVPGVTGSFEGVSGPHESFATASSHIALESLPYFIPTQIPSQMQPHQFSFRVFVTRELSFWLKESFMKLVQRV